MLSKMRSPPSAETGSEQRPSLALESNNNNNNNEGHSQKHEPAEVDDQLSVSNTHDDDDDDLAAPEERREDERRPEDEEESTINEAASDTNNNSTRLAANQNDDEQSQQTSKKTQDELLDIVELSKKRRLSRDSADSLTSFIRWSFSHMDLSLSGNELKNPANKQLVVSSTGDSGGSQSDDHDVDVDDEDRDEEEFAAMKRQLDEVDGRESRNLLMVDNRHLPLEIDARGDNNDDADDDEAEADEQKFSATRPFDDSRRVLRNRGATTAAAAARQLAQSANVANALALVEQHRQGIKRAARQLVQSPSSSSSPLADGSQHFGKTSKLFASSNNGIANKHRVAPNSSSLNHLGSVVERLHQQRQVLNPSHHSNTDDADDEDPTDLSNTAPPSASATDLTQSRQSNEGLSFHLQHFLQQQQQQQQRQQQQQQEASLENLCLSMGLEEGNPQQLALAAAIHRALADQQQVKNSRSQLLEHHQHHNQLRPQPPYATRPNLNASALNNRPGSLNNQLLASLAQGSHPLHLGGQRVLPAALGGSGSANGLASFHHRQQQLTNNHLHHHHHNSLSHLNSTLNQMVEFKCDICPSSFDDRHRLMQHQSIHLELKKDWFTETPVDEVMKIFNRRRGEFLCNTCNLRFEATLDYDQHNHAVHGARPYCCQFCGNGTRTFKCWRQYLNHLYDHRYIFSCTIDDCDFTVNRRDSLRFHIFRFHLNCQLPQNQLKTNRIC